MINTTNIKKALLHSTSPFPSIDSKSQQRC